MNPPTIDGSGADAGDAADRGNGNDEPLFGDVRWIAERLEALLMQGAAAAGPGAN